MSTDKNIAPQPLQLPYDPVFGRRLLGLMIDRQGVPSPTTGEAVGFLYPLLELATAQRMGTKVPGKTVVNDTRALYLGLQGDYSPKTYSEAVDGLDPEVWSHKSSGSANRHKLIPERVIDCLHSIPDYAPKDIRDKWESFTEDGAAPVPDPIEYPQEVFDRRAYALRQPVPNHVFIHGLRLLKRILAPQGIPPESIIKLGVSLLNVFTAEGQLSKLEASVDGLQRVAKADAEPHAHLEFALAAPLQGSNSGLRAVTKELPLLDVHYARRIFLKSLATIAVPKA